jgi:hypothetical protein
MPRHDALPFLPAELWGTIYDKVARMELWDMRLAHIDGLLRSSFSRWIDSYHADDIEPDPSRYVFDPINREYCFMDDDHVDALFGDSSEEDFVSSDEE